MLIIKVKQLRLQKGWTQRELAESSGLSKSKIDRIERGESKVMLEDMCDIAHAFGVPVTETYEYHYIDKNPQSG